MIHYLTWKKMQIENHVIGQENVFLIDKRYNLLNCITSNHIKQKQGKNRIVYLTNLEYAFSMNTSNTH